MIQFDGELRMYAENGLRTAEDWGTLGREVEDQSRPRADTMLRGTKVSLYTRDQTRHRAKRIRIST